MNWSLHCHSHCLQFTIPASITLPAAAPEDIDLSFVASEYHGLLQVFSKDRVLSLPLHRPYDCAIDLLPGAPLPTCKLYNLSKPEREPMEDYIKDSLSAGLIRPSSSSVGAVSFLRLEKKTNPCAFALTLEG